MEECFANALSDEEACLIADVSPAALYRYCESNPEFRERKELLKKRPSIKAKTNKVKAINNGDQAVSSWWLERMERKTFGNDPAQVLQAIMPVQINFVRSDAKPLPPLVRDGGGVPSLENGR